MGDPDAVKNDYGAVNEAEKDKLVYMCVYRLLFWIIIHVINIG